jgi:alkylation response protein AidB-like acyl-CoA dehydrogenase
MPESLTPELIALRSRTERFAVEVLLPYRQAAKASSSADLDELRRTVVAAARGEGFFGMTQPAAFGGTEADPLALTVLRDTLAGYNTGLDRLVFGPGPGVLAGCGEPLRSRYLEPLLDGRMRAGFAFTEPDDAEHFTRALPQPEGDYRVDGRKSYVTRGGEADFLNVLVDVPGAGRTILVIDADAPGVAIERRFETLDGSHHAAFRFDAVRVAADRMVGRPGEGLPRALGQIGDTRLAVSARAVGLARWVVQHVCEHVTGVHRSGEPLAAREGVRLRYAEMRIRTFAARSMVYRTARLAQSGAGVINECIASKVFATEVLCEVVDAAMELVGGKSLTVGHPLEELYRVSRALRTAEGAADVLRLSLAKGSLDLGRGVL